MEVRKWYYLRRKDAPEPSDSTYKIIPFKVDEVTIGRSQNVTFSIADTLISRRHAVFSRSGDEWTVRNLSLNGVFVNGVLLPKEEAKEVKLGDILQFGLPAEFVYQFCMKVSSGLKGGNSCNSSQGSLIQSVKRIRSDRQENLTHEHECLAKRLKDSDALQTRLQDKCDKLQVSLHEQKDDLQQQYRLAKEALENKFDAGSLAQQAMLEEKEALATRLENQVLELQTRLEQEHKQLEERLRNEEEQRCRISQEKEDVLQKLEEEKKNLEQKMKEERQRMEEQLKTTESHRERLQMQVEAKESMIKAKEAEQLRADHEREQLKAESALEKQKLEEELEKVRLALLEKDQQLDSELKSKEVELQDKMLTLESGVQERVTAEVEKSSAMVREEATKQLEEMIKEKTDLQDKLMMAQLQEHEQMHNLQDALSTVEAQKLSLEQELACTAIANDNVRKEVVDHVADVLENELQCPICNELFITAIMLGCSHTFCKYCIDQWKKNKRECPNCRKAITSETRSLVVDNFIEKIVPTLCEEMQKKRNEMVAERNAELAAAAAAQVAVAAARAAAASNRGGRRGRGRGRNAAGQRQATRRRGGASNASANTNIPTVAEIPQPVPSEPVLLSSDSGDTSDTSMHSDSSSLSGDEMSYYGGYGRCFNCGRRGHWATGCPDIW